ncbi:aminoacyl-tRNA hydrolase [Flagellatimonas centrodinii]|uniref:alternative ribosome rescue aminoacyl-tRNA hydrolase ArfB n=1 Tax=Flagellatimonas centrodinii TaxID=2806210 RepID=UPI001FEFBEDE|nr:alternative ribosome rescue aminoacyl-tRNA hydrolase ArfB [Flagellatimonas centrodinii]ULQ45389.1 aminoacyl-tRNA hydrolase [Flagellatimonas centrodinii]
MSTLSITDDLEIATDEVVITAIRAEGAGGQNVNKRSSAVHLRFHIGDSSLPEAVKTRLLAMRDHRITDVGEIVIKAQEFRSQEQNRVAALARLTDLLRQAATVRPARRPTRPTRASRQRRLDGKAHQGRVKRLRGRIED